MRVPGTAAVRHLCRVHTAGTADNQQVNHFGEMDHDSADSAGKALRASAIARPANGSHP